MAKLKNYPGASDFWRSGVGGTDLPDGNGDTTKAIRRDGFIGIGVDPLIAFHAADDAATGFVADTYINTASSTSGDERRRARGTRAAPLAVVSNDAIGLYRAWGHDGTDFGWGWSILGRATENWTPAAHGAAITFVLVTNGTIAPVERMRLTGAGFLGIGTNAPVARLDVAGAQILRPVVLANFAANAAIGTAAATIDIASVLVIPQTTYGIFLTLPNPTSTQAGRILKVINSGTAFVTVAGQQITPGTFALFEWSGTAWIPAGDTPGAVTVAASRAAVPSDHGKTLLVTAAATITVNANTFPYGVFRIRQSGAGAATIAVGAGMTLVNLVATTTVGNGSSLSVEVIGTNVYVE